LEEVGKTINPKMKDFTSLQEEIQLERGKAKILKTHADFDEIVNSDDFHEWAVSQPERVQDLIYSDVPENAIWAISAFKKETDYVKDDTSKEAAKTVVKKGSTSSPKDNSGKPLFKESDVEAMTLAEFEKHEEAIYAAQRDGRYVYDLSGAVR
jgi:hypothetical protein